jgi:hypothetical protein
VVAATSVAGGGAVPASLVRIIPEIWQGHMNGGEGFWGALDRLETWFGRDTLLR